MGPADLASATPPEACGLAIAIPLSWAEFMADLNAPDTMEFSRLELLRGRPAEAAWAEDGAPLADLCHRLCDEAAAMGVEIAARATPADAATLFERKRIVTLVAHWRDAAFRGDDFLVEPVELVRRLQANTDPVSRALAARLDATRLTRILELPSRTSRARALAETFDVALTRPSTPLPGCLPPGPVLIDTASLHARQREAVDLLFPDMLRRGNRIELRDGAHTPEVAASWVGPAWSGIVDLAICQSAYVAHRLKNGRSEVRVAFNKNAVVLPIRLRVIREIYRRLAKTGGNYARELMSVFRDLGEMEVKP